MLLQLLEVQDRGAAMQLLERDGNLARLTCLSPKGKGIELAGCAEFLQVKVLHTANQPQLWDASRWKRRITMSLLPDQVSAVYVDFGLDRTQRSLLEL